MVQPTGIVLKKISSYKVALLDKKRGRIDAIIVSPICIGAWVHYTIKKEQFASFYLADLKIYDLPLAVARDDILFWHHVLELCFYFVPPGNYMPELFELCTFLYTVDTTTGWSAQSKKLYLFKLLQTIGVYPQLPQFSVEKLNYFNRMPLAAIGKVVIDEQHEKKLNEWLRICVADHPAIARFKTIHYLLAQ